MESTLKKLTRLAISFFTVLFLSVVIKRGIEFELSIMMVDVYTVLALIDMYMLRYCSAVCLAYIHNKYLLDFVE